MPPLRDLVLIGGGHAHVEVLRRFGMRPLPGLRITLISRETLTPYSGMLPGLVAGRYQPADAHIDLVPLAGFAGARLIEDELIGLDVAARRLRLADHPDLRFDLLSLNSGAVPARPGEIGLVVKPIGRFLPQLHDLCLRLRAGQRLVLIGGGPGGVELALALRRSLSPSIHIHLVTERLLPGLSGGMRRRLQSELNLARIDVETGFRVERAETGQIRSEDGRTIAADHLIWVTGVAAPDWPRAAGLATDAEGFVRVDSSLRSVSHPAVFAAGDIAALVGQERPKAGVFAVREGPVLAANLRRALLDQPLRRYRAQRRFLVIAGLGNGRAVAGRGRFSAQGAWVWRWKDRIDRRFVARFHDLPPMPPAVSRIPKAFASQAPDPMRCTGCASKLGAGLLGRVLARLPLQTAPGIILGIGDDAAVVSSRGEEQILCVDGFADMIGDAYRFGRIVAHHCLNDVIAMGAQGESALAFACVPLMAEEMMEEELYQLIRGAVDVLNAAGVALVGGHSVEGAVLTLALTLTGNLHGERLLTKSGLVPGQALILTKPIGTGVVLAAHQRGIASGTDFMAAVAHMDQSNLAALGVLRSHGVTALTDVSGFGLLGHLGEMLRASGVGANLDADRIQSLPGARELIHRGVSSSLQGPNSQICGEYQISAQLPDWQRQLLIDPQTSGGLLAGVPAASADACVHDLRAAGFSAAACVGRITGGGWSVTVR